MKDKNNYKLNTRVIKELRDIEESEDIKRFWADASWHPYTDMDYYLNIVTNEEGFVHPYIILKYFDNKPISMVIGQIKTVNVYLSIGYKNVLRSKARSLRIFYGGILGDLSESNIQDLFQTIKYSLKQSEFEFVLFEYLNIDSKIIEIAKRVFKLKLHNLFTLTHPHWLLNLPSDFEKYLESKSKRVRRNAKYYSNRIKKKYGNQIELKYYRNFSDLDEFVKHTSEVSQKTYQHNFKSSMADNLQTREIMKFAFDKEWLRSYVIYINSVPVAFWNGFMYNRTFFTGATGYLAEYQADRLGTNILLWMINDMIKEDDINKIDFGFGDADYKRIYGTEKLMQANILVFVSSLRGLKLLAMSIISNFILLFSIKVLNKLKILNWIKKKWRVRLRNKRERD